MSCVKLYRALSEWSAYRNTFRDRSSCARAVRRSSESVNRNVEIKARLTHLESAQARLRDIGAEECGVLVQCDTFFKCNAGRLKLRVHGNGTGQLIYYERPDKTDAKTSHYLISETGEPQGLLETLSAALGIAGEVRKTRRLYTIGQTRIHLDQVESVGDFVEIEVVLEPSQTEERDTEIAVDSAQARRQ